MLFIEIEAAIARASTGQLAAVEAALWQGIAAGGVTEAQADTLGAMLQARRVGVVRAPGEAPRAKVGSRPRSGASLERRRRWAASGYMPAQLAAKFTGAELAALSVVAAEVMKRGDCRLPHGLVAALAGVSRSTVKAAIREARRLGLVTIEERRVSRHRNLSNIVRVVAREWRGWLAHRAASSRPAAVAGGGVKSPAGTNTRVLPKETLGRLVPSRAIEVQNREGRRYSRNRACAGSFGR